MNIFKSLTIIAALGLCTFANGQNKAEGGISTKMLEQIREGYQGTPAEKALRNAITHNSIKDLALNQENEANFDTYFSDVVKSKGITDQNSSGRCWLYTGLNVLRSNFIQKNNLGSFQFSQSYNFFWDQLEKANLFLQEIINTKDLAIDDRKVDWLFRHALSDGGQFTGVSDNIMKYGIVPATVMPETFSSENTREMGRLLNLKLKEFGLELRDMKKGTEKRKVEMLAFVYRFLVLNLGEPPVNFEWTMYDSKGEPVSTKTYTPQSFYQEYFGQDLRERYVLLMNDPSREFYKTYEIDMDRHLYDGVNWIYINLPIDEIKKMGIASIKDNTMMYFSCDVGKFLLSKKGLLDINNYDYGSLMGTTFGMDKKQRVQTGASGSSHAMTLMAVDLDENGNPKKWMVENSWGAASGYKGHLIMTDEWFNEYMFRLVVDKKYVPENILKLLEATPTLLPAWDPMFAPEN